MNAGNRGQLADFLRSRRARLTPADVGLPGDSEPGRRRTPGLRREEVAELSGVGVTWYTWLEQGRKITASPQVVDALARALRLSADEHRHLRELAGLAVAAPASGDNPQARLQRLVDAAAAAFPGWAELRPADKQAMFLRAADIVERRQAEITALLAAETGCAGAFAGFSTVEPWLPVADDFRSRNVDEELRDPGSIHGLYRRLIAARRRHGALSAGTYRRGLVQGDLLLLERQSGSEGILIALNFGSQAISTTLPPGLAPDAIADAIRARLGAE